MTESQARNWAYAAAAAGVIANALFIAFYASFTVQHFAEPHGVTAVLGSADDYAGIPQNALLAVITGVVFRFLSRQQRSDQVLRIAGAVAFATAAAQGVLTVTGLLPGVSAVAVGAVLAATVWLLAVGIRGARLPGPGRARVARTAWLIAATMLCSAVVALTGLAIGVAAVVWTGLIAGSLAWLSIPLWVLAMGRVLAPSGPSGMEDDMAPIRNTTLINRPIEEVFDFAVDTRNEFKWNPKVRAMTKLTDGPIGFGTRMAAKWTMSGQIELVCTEYERPCRWAWANGGPIAVTVTVTLSEEAGGTRLRAAFDARPHGLARLFFPVFIRIMRKDEARNMDYLRACLESGRAAQASSQP